MELWDLYNEKREPLGKTMVRGDRIPEGCRHVVVQLMLFNSKGQMLIQHRQPFKDGWPDKWDVTAGGSMVAGEYSQTALEREVGEEIGLHFDFKKDVPLISRGMDHAFMDIYTRIEDIDISKCVCQPEEVSEVRWAEMDEIYAMIDDGTFIPYRKCYLQLIKELTFEGRRIHTRDE